MMTFCPLTHPISCRLFRNASICGVFFLGRATAKKPDAVQLPGLLRLGGKGRDNHASSERTDEGSPVHHSITWSARPSTDGGMVRPSAFAVLRLMTRSYLVGCSTGRSAGLAPLRILSTKAAERR